jgi:large subunit ribosomal protein L19
MPEKKDVDANEVQDIQENAGKDSDQNAPADAQLKSDNDKDTEVSSVDEKKDQVESKGNEDETKDEPEKIETAEKSATEEKISAEDQPVSPKTVWNGNINHYVEIRKDLPEIKSGDVVRVSYRVIEGGKERIQFFEGIVIAMKNSGISRTITVRKTSFGIAVERVFPLNSRLVQKIEVKKHSKVRRAKLYYLRKLRGKAARLKELR